MTVHDLTTKFYNVGSSLVPAGSMGKVARRITGKMLTDPVLGGGSIPAEGDSYKILKIGRHQLVTRVWTIVTTADGTSITLSIGRIYGTTHTANTFEADADLATTGATEAADDKVFMHKVDTGYLTITPSTLVAMDDALEFVIMAEIIDLSDVGIATALTATI